MELHPSPRTVVWSPHSAGISWKFVKICCAGYWWHPSPWLAPAPHQIARSEHESCPAERSHASCHLDYLNEYKEKSMKLLNAVAFHIFRYSNTPFPQESPELAVCSLHWAAAVSFSVSLHSRCRFGANPSDSPSWFSLQRSSGSSPDVWLIYWLYSLVGNRLVR